MQFIVLIELLVPKIGSTRFANFAGSRVRLAAFPPLQPAPSGSPELLGCAISRVEVFSECISEPLSR